MKNPINKNLSIYKNIFWAIITLLVITATFSLLFETGKPPIELSVSDLAGKINKGEVEKIAVRGNDLFIDLKNKDKAVAKKEPESGLSQTLNNYGVDPKALQSVNLEIQDQSGWKFWAELLLPVVLPLLIIGAMFWFLFGQAKAGAGESFQSGQPTLKTLSFF